MQNKWWTIFNIFILIVISLTLISVVWKFSFEESEIPPLKCVDVEDNVSFSYNACYDAYSKNILLEVQRGQDNYDIRALKISFFDIAERVYELDNVPDVKESELYRISADKNPGNIYAALDVGGDFLIPICDKPKKFFVDYCPSVKKEGVDVSMTPLGGTSLDDFAKVGPLSRRDSDVLDLSLVEKEKLWESKCKSSWDCGEWESCVDGLQRRECSDYKNCFIPTDVPDAVKYCSDTCVENWECEWSVCKDGFTSPTCMDIGGCGTSYDIPHKLKCEDNAQCVPDIGCEEWSECAVDYNFLDLTEGVVSNLRGIKSRYCVDKNSCVGSKKEAENCSVNVDIYTKKITRCGENFVGIYDGLNNNLIARVKEGYEFNPHLNIYLDEQQENDYCDYCFDGIMDGDEEGVDCGGSCESCSDRYRKVSFEKRGQLDNFVDWIKGIFMIASLLN